MLRFLPLLALTAVSFLLPQTAGASAPVSGGGDFAVTSDVVTSSRNADGNTFLTIAMTTDVTGTLAGTIVTDETAVVHPNGVITIQAAETFTGTVDGIAGTLQFDTVGIADAATGAVTGRFTIVDGGGGLANLHGQGTVAGVGSAGTYTIEIAFDPEP
jgi:hypothetical protein